MGCEQYYPVQNREGIGMFPDEITKYFWESTEDGGDYEIIGDIIYILIGQEDVDNFPLELKGSLGKYFSLIETYGGYIDPLGVVGEAPTKESIFPDKIVIYVEDFPPH